MRASAKCNPLTYVKAELVLSVEASPFIGTSAGPDVSDFYESDAAIKMRPKYVASNLSPQDSDPRRHVDDYPGSIPRAASAGEQWGLSDRDSVDSPYTSAASTPRMKTQGQRMSRHTAHRNAVSFKSLAEVVPSITAPYT